MAMNSPGGGGNEPLEQADIDAVLAATTTADADASLAGSSGSAPSPYDLPAATDGAPALAEPPRATPAALGPERAVWDALDEPSFDAGAEPHNLNLVLDIPLEVSVELGRKRMSIRDILDLGAGSIVELDKIAGEPVDLLVNGRLVARGEVVVIEDNFGVRITEIVGGRGGSATGGGSAAP